MLRNRTAQSTLEYAVIIAVVVAALLAIQIYMKRGVQGKLRESTDQVGEQFDIEKTNIDMTTERAGKTVQTQTTGGVSQTDYTGVSQKEFGTETVDKW